MLESEGLSDRCKKKTLLTRLAERVRVPSTILCVSVTGFRNCT